MKRTTSELEIIVNHINEKVEMLTKSITENTEITRKTLEQATKTNGRVNVIEPLALDYAKRLERFRGGVVVVSSIGGIVIAAGAYITNLYLDKMSKDIQVGVVKEIEARYNIQYEKQNN